MKTEGFFFFNQSFVTLEDCRTAQVLAFLPYLGFESRMGCMEFACSLYAFVSFLQLLPPTVQKQDW